MPLQRAVSLAAMAAMLATAPVARAQTIGPGQSPTPATAGAPPIADTAAVAVPPGRSKGDPFERLNRRLFSGSQKFDRSFFRPIALGYKTVIPKFIRTGLRHLLAHLKEPVVFLNDVLQLKPKRAGKTLGRFIINSTLGVAGLLDVAKDANLPRRSNGFGNTLARYGVGPGPYLFLPFLGPTTLRDVFGGQADALTLPVAIGKPFNRLDYQISTTIIGTLDLRAESDLQLKSLLDGAADPYATLRSVYLQSRVAEIAEIKGEADATQGGLEDPLLDPEAAPGSGAAPIDVSPAPDDLPVDPDPADPVEAPEGATPPSSAALTPASFYAI